ncbi:aminoglycoside phosphotransferase [Pseudonocardia sp. N23]|uniref:maltokinase N-terminal cap-like domain-containing protein n=1 Tax=Pseudonocardia sp. N23 TaxID=1987376 RepID=UPI000BFB3684|nr:aminoglycoside phosphotransferase [Pseudonocardia sp. N23]GAY12365.1 trehalose synthase [Pseudonocardia sp. N23]
MNSPSPDPAALLTDWIPRQRWFGAKGREVGSVTVVATTPLPVDTPDGPLDVDHVVVEVTFADGGPTAHFQVLAASREGAGDEFEHAAIGTLGDRLLYDGLWDPAVTSWLLRAIREGRTVGDLRFLAEPGIEIPPAPPGRVLGVEQSNTSVVYGEKSILKLFRRVVAGGNPDLELHRAMRASGGTEVATLQGAIEGVLHGESAVLGMLQDYASNSAEGWAMALASVRDLLAEADLRADEVGGDFAAEANRLGQTVAVLHSDLVRALGTAERDAGELAAAMRARLAVAAAAVPSLQPHVEAIRAVYDELAAHPAPLFAQRVHGDLHLGQVLRTPLGWLVIDFEGEPATPLELRVRPDSPLRDVAGMLRSFDYAANHQLLEADEPEADPQRVWRSAEWAQRNRSAFLDGYATRAGADPREHELVLRAYELDKAVYEVVYETRNRPSWAPIPLRSIARLLDPDRGRAELPTDSVQ